MWQARVAVATPHLVLPRRRQETRQFRSAVNHKAQKYRQDEPATWEDDLSFYAAAARNMRTSEYDTSHSSGLDEPYSEQGRVTFGTVAPEISHDHKDSRELARSGRTFEVAGPFPVISIHQEASS